MGKGTIISGGTDGQYQVSVVYNTDRAQAEKAANLDKIANLESQIASETDDRRLNVLILQKLSVEKRNAAIVSIPESETISAWCADLTEDITGDVGLIEVPGESENFNIQPGYGGEASYDAGRDGQLFPTMAISPAAAFYNLAMLPGWQKWKPTYRYGTISNLSGDTADVTLESSTSTQQGLGVNQEDTLTGVTIEYMDCNGAAFEDGDAVLVQFIGQDFSSPKVIGFKQEPKPCGRTFLVITTDFWRAGIYHQYCTVWDIKTEKVVDFAKDSNGNPIVFPTWKGADVNAWINTLETVPMVAIVPEITTMVAATDIPYECDDLSTGDGHVHQDCVGIIHGAYYDVEGTSTNLISTSEWEEHWTLDENDHHDELISRWSEQYIPIRVPLVYGVTHKGMGWYFEFLGRNRGMYFDRELSGTSAGGTVGSPDEWTTSLTYNFYSPFQGQAEEIAPITHSVSNEDQLVENAIYDTDVMISACGSLDLSEGYESYYACISTLRVTGGPKEADEWLVPTSGLIELRRNTSGYIYKLKEGENINTIDPFDMPIHIKFSTAVDDLFALTLENKSDYVRNQWAEITDNISMSVYKL